jgi:hypothetical protein
VIPRSTTTSESKFIPYISGLISSSIILPIVLICGQRHPCVPHIAEILPLPTAPTQRAAGDLPPSLRRLRRELP